MYSIITELHKKATPVSTSCNVLCVSKSGYYASLLRQQQEVEVDPLEVHLKAIFEENGRCYGSRRLMRAMHAKGFKIGRHKVRSMMNKLKLIPTWKRKFVHTTNSKHDLPIAENVLARQFEQAYPNTAWVSDITYVRTDSGWLYVAVVQDLFSRKIIGWAMAPSMPADLVCAALQMAITQRNPAPGLIVHSDRGSQYASEQYQQLLAKHGMICSMSRKGNCWDNAVMERFFLNLKMERVWQKRYANHHEAMCDITDYIVVFYNQTRLNSVLGYLSPNAFEKLMTEKRPVVLSEKT
jgi:transposase InsO family protein